MLLTGPEHSGHKIVSLYSPQKIYFQKYHHCVCGHRVKSNLDLLSVKLGPLDPYVTSVSRIDSRHKICSLPRKQDLEYIIIEGNNKMEDFPDV